MTKQSRKTWDHHITQKEKQQMTLALKMVHLNVFRRRTCLLMGKLAWLGNKTNETLLYNILFNELLAMDTAFFEECLHIAVLLLA